MTRPIILACALTGAGDTTGKSEHVPITPERIAEDAIAAARAGASMVHIHVRDVETGQGSREVSLYREVVQRLRASDVDPVINLTAGMGGDLVLDPENPTRPLPGTDLVSGLDRLPHVEELRPEVCRGGGVHGGGQWADHCQLDRRTRSSHHRHPQGRGFRAG